MIEHVYKELYNQDSVDKQLNITFEGGTITNTDLYNENFELTESLCSESELRFGSCEASVLKFKIANTVGSLKNKVLTVSEVLNGQTDTPFQIGKYKVDSHVPSGDRNYRDIVAYDFMYDIINANVADWYNALTFPMTQKSFRNSFFDYFGIEQEEIVLIHDDMIIEKTIGGTEISGKTIITAVCELNGVFGHINRHGRFAYIELSQNVQETIDKNRHISSEFEDFATCLISKLQIRQEENDIGAIAGNGVNSYVINDNFLVYGKTANTLQKIAERTFEKIRYISYRPFKAQVRGNPCLEVGDRIVLQSRNKDIESCILERKLYGIQSLKDSFDSKGVYEYTEKANSLLSDIQKLKGKSNVLERNIEETKSIISDVERGLQSQVIQNAESLKIIIEDTKKANEELAEILLSVTSALNKTEISIGSTIEEYTSEEVPRLSNYPTFTDFFIWKACSDILYCADNLICGTNDYDSHLNEVLKNTKNNKYYIFELKNGVYYWREMTSAEIEILSEKHSSVRVYSDEVVISSSKNENIGQLRITPDGVKATALYCC